MRLASVIAFLLWPLASLPAITSERVRDGEVAIELVSPAETVAPGQTIEVGIRFLIDEKWHTYWRNPGDTGLPPDIKWDLPEGIEPGEIRWPYPTIYRNNHLVDFVYFEEVTLYTSLTVPTDWPVGEIFPIGAEVNWLMCEEICIPGQGSLSLAIPVAEVASLDPKEQAALEATQQKWPAAPDSIQAAMRTNAKTVQLLVDGLESAPAPPGELFLFPVDPLVAPAEPQQWQWQEDQLVANLVRSDHAAVVPEVFRGVLYSPEGWPGMEGRKALWIEASLAEGGPLAVGAGSASATGSGGLAWLLILAFAGGAVLNLMPCVFPVLGLKIMGFVEQAGSDKAKIISHGLLFTLGVLVSFWILSGALLALRASGNELGWGFQLQSAPFVFGMAAFLLLFALNLSGVFEIGFGLMTLGNKAGTKKGASGSFFSGVLATIVATPCSAPILATALAGALTLPPFQSILTFTFIALGLSAPYLLLTIFPNLLKALPKPGAWMETLKQFLAFPLYATVGWLIYVLAGQLSDDRLLSALLALTLLSLGAWIYGRYSAPYRKKNTRRIGGILALLLIASAIGYGYPKKETLTWIPWSPQTIESLRDDDRIIYVDFTARWCATCQVNKTVVFSSEKVLDFIDKNKVALVKADWTSEDPAITRRLAELGKAAVPVTLVYLPTEEEPRILPETLVPSTVLRAFRAD